MSRASNDTKNVKTKRLTQKDIKKYSNTQLDHVIERIKEQESKFTAILVTVILVSLLLAFYSIFSSIQDSTSQYVLKSNNLTITYKEKDNNMGDIISFVNDDALSDTDGMKSDDYRVFITNTSNRSVIYNIEVVDDLDMISHDNCTNKKIDRKYIKYSIDGGDILSLSDDNIIQTAVLKAESKIEYSLKFWIDDSFKDANKSHYHGKIVVSELSPDKK